MLLSTKYSSRKYLYANSCKNLNVIGFINRTTYARTGLFVLFAWALKPGRLSTTPSGLGCGA